MGVHGNRRPQSGWLFCACLGLLLCAVAVGQQRDMQSAEGQFRFAEGLFVRGFHDLAEAEFRLFVETYPAHELAPQAMFRLIRSLRIQEKTDDTLSAINQFQARWPEHEMAPKLFLWKGEILFARQKYETAASCFKRLLSNDDSLVREASLYFLAQCYARQSQADLALETYGKLADLPFDETHIYRPYALFAQAVANQLRGAFAQAVAAFTRLSEEEFVPAAVREESLYRLAETHFAQGRFAAAIERFEVLLVDHPDGPFAREARKRRAWAHFALQDYAKAVAAARDWRERHGEVFDYELDYIHGTSLLGVDFYAEALPFFERLAEDQRVPEEYRRLSRFQHIVALLNLQRYEDCAHLAGRFVADFPTAADVPTAHFMAGESLWHLERFEEAVGHFRRALDSFTGDWEYLESANLRLTDALIRLERHADAAAVFRAYAADTRAERQAFYLLRAGECERKAGNAPQAVADFEMVLSEFPEAGDEAHAAMLHLGELYSDDGDYTRAESMVRNLLQEPKQRVRARLLFFLGYLCYQQGRYEEAAAHLRDALADRDAGVISGSAKFYLGGALLELEQTDEALEVFAEVLKLPAADRPQFPPGLLFRLEELYYARSRFDVSEAICRWLISWDDGGVVYRASLRLCDILTARNALAEAEDVLVTLQDEVKRGALSFADGQTPLPEEAQSVLAEVYLLQGKYDQAVRAAETCLNQANLGIDFLTRARWVMGEVLLRENHPNQALPYAVKCFVLADHPVYTPRAMMQAVRIFAALGKQRDARTTWQELRERFPAFAEQQRSSALIQGLLDDQATTPQAEGDPQP